MKWLLVLRLIISISIISANVTSDSMNELLKRGDRVIAIKDAFVSDYNRYDVIIFKNPLNNNELYIKRIIGMPGEKIVIENGNIYINDSKVPLEEKYLSKEWVVDNDGYTFYVPEDAFLVLGDNRNNSEDPRYWEEIAIKEGNAQNIEDVKRYIYIRKENIYAKMLFKISFLE